MLQPVTLTTQAEPVIRRGKKKLSARMWDHATIVLADTQRIPCEVVEIYNDRRVKVRELAAVKVTETKGGKQTWKLESSEKAKEHFITRRKVGRWMLKNTNKTVDLGRLDPYMV